jgi:hypothetical protein
MAKKGGWYGDSAGHRKARYKGLGIRNWKAHHKKTLRQTARGLKKDRAIKAKHTRSRGQPHWRGDLKGSRV